jgi:hypothetical protein
MPQASYSKELYNTTTYIDSRLFDEKPCSNIIAEIPRECNLPAILLQIAFFPERPEWVA